VKISSESARAQKNSKFRFKTSLAFVPSSYNNIIMKLREHPISRVLYSHEDIASAVENVASAIHARFGTTQYENVIFLPCMTGAMFFASDVMRRLHQMLLEEEEVIVDLELGSCVATSYENVNASGVGSEKVKNVHVKGNVRGKTVVVIEDIVDTGNTLVTLCDTLYAQGAKDVHCATLLNKQARRREENTKAFERLLARENDAESKEEGLYIGIECEDEFVVGFGLDYNGAYRGLPYIGVLTEKAIREMI
jgi:hypoxanthine phosphoribosyltransferase